MPFHFTCPFCHHRTLVEDRFAGSSGPCVECGREVTIPGKWGSNQASTGAEPPVIQGSDREKARKQHVRVLVNIVFATVVIFVLFGISSFILIPFFTRAKEFRDRNVCLNNMRQIVTALNAYAKDHGTYPTPIVTDAAGKPLYSWRVLILPQLGYQDLYNRFQLDQPWNSPTNFALFTEMPGIYASPASLDARSQFESNYVLLTGNGTLFPPTGPLSPSQILDDPSQTILVVETANGKCKWSEPGDINASLGVTLGNRPNIDIGGNHPNGVNVVAADGTMMVLPMGISGAMVDAMRTPDGGERLDTSGLKR